MLKRISLACLWLSLAAMAARADQVLLKDGKIYTGIVFSTDVEPLLKIMQDSEVPVYINREQVQSVTLGTEANRTDLIQIARLKDTLRARDRQYTLLKEQFDQLQAQYQKLKEEIDGLKNGSGGAGATGVHKDPAPFIRILTHEVKHSADTVKVTGVIQNDGDRDAPTAEILVYMYDEAGNQIGSFRKNALADGGPLGSGTMIDFEFAENVGKDAIAKLTSTKVVAVNEFAAELPKK